MINYADKHHIYFNNDNIIYDSPTKILKKYKKRFDAKTASIAYAKKFGKTPSYWREQWKQKSSAALDRGHKIHSEREEGSFGRGIERVDSGIKPVLNGYLHYKGSLSDLPDGIYPEFPVWNDGWMIAGRPDKFVIETIGDDRFVDIIDYKTNGKIDKISWQDYNGNYQHLLAPVQHLMDSKWVEYALQLSMYQYILETHGFKPRNRQLIHIPHPIELAGVVLEQPKDVIYPLPYLKDEVLAILNDHNKKRKTARYEPNQVTK